MEYVHAWSVVVPLIAVAYLAFASGLLMTYLGLGYVAGILVVLRGVWVAWRPSAVAVSVVVMFVAGVVIAKESPPPRNPFSSGASVAHGGAGQWLARQRMRASRAIEVVFRDDAPLAKALLIADQHEIPKDVKNRYATAGIIHMLSISGLHVAIIAGAVELLFHVLRLPIRVAKLAAVGIIIVYVMIIGFPAPAVRSGAMVGMAAVSRVMQRPTSKWAALAVGAFIPLIVPATILDLGYQLSVAGIAGLIASGALARKWVQPRWSGWKESLARGLLASSVATVVSAPLVSWSFGRISIIAPLTNMLADPLVGLAQPMLFLALLLAPFHGAAIFIADATHPVLAAFDAIATYGSAVPYASLTYTPTCSAAIFAGIASAAMVVACVSRFPARALLVAAGALCGLMWF